MEKDSLCACRISKQELSGSNRRLDPSFYSILVILRKLFSWVLAVTSSSLLLPWPLLWRQMSLPSSFT